MVTRNAADHMVRCEMVDWFGRTAIGTDLYRWGIFLSTLDYDNSSNHSCFDGRISNPLRPSVVDVCYQFNRLIERN